MPGFICRAGGVHTAWRRAACNPQIERTFPRASLGQLPVGKEQISEGMLGGGEPVEVCRASGVFFINLGYFKAKSITL